MLSPSMASTRVASRTWWRQAAAMLHVLEDCRLLPREPDLFQSGRVQYRIAEPLVTFYQAIMSREWARLEIGDAPTVWQGARARFLSQVVGPHFESICRDYAITAGPHVLGGPPGEVGAGGVSDPPNPTPNHGGVARPAPPQPRPPPA